MAFKGKEYTEWRNRRWGYERALSKGQKAGGNYRQ
jgi:hypothetical protein